MLEFLGSLKGNQQVWFQMIIRADREVNWRDEARQGIKNILAGKGVDGKGEGDAEDATKLGEQRLTQGSKDMIKVIERSLSKPAFEVAMRAIYFSPKEEQDSTKVSSLLGMLKPFGAQNYNSFGPINDTSFFFPWQDRKDKRKLIALQNRMFKKYVLRTFGPYWNVFDSFSIMWEIQVRIDHFLRHGHNYFKKNLYSKGNFILTNEELATIYHFPGKVASTPTFKRISSTKSEAPNNLPV